MGHPAGLIVSEHGKAPFYGEEDVWRGLEETTGAVWRPSHRRGKDGRSPVVSAVLAALILVWRVISSLDMVLLGLLLKYLFREGISTVSELGQWDVVF